MIQLCHSLTIGTKVKHENVGIYLSELVFSCIQCILFFCMAFKEINAALNSYGKEGEYFSKVIWKLITSKNNVLFSRY